MMLRIRQCSMYPRCHFSRVVRLHGTGQFLRGLYDDEVRYATDLAVSWCIFVDVYVAFIDGEVGEFFIDEIPVKTLTCPAPFGCEIDENGGFGRS